MNEISPEDAQLIIEAAATGSSVAGHEALGAALTDLHAPPAAGELAGAAPSAVGVGSPGVVARLSRRTAVAASAAVFSIAGVAAAATGGELLDGPAFDVDGPAIVELVDDGGEDADDEAEAPDDEAEAPADDEGDGDDDGDEADHGNNRDELLELIDPTDGIDDDELEVICDEANNHGSYVSTVARDKVDEEKGGHGERVSAAAQSDCGKADDDDGDEDADDEGDDEDADDADEDDGDDEDADENDGDEADEDRGNGRGNGTGNGNGNGHGKGNGNGHGNGNGNGHDKGADD